MKMVIPKIPLSIAILSLTLLFFSCDNVSGVGGYIPNADYLGTNNSVYKHTFFIIDSLGNKISDFKDTVTISVSIEEKAINGISPSIKIIANSRSAELNGIGSDNYTQTRWYSQANDTVYCTAYSGSGGMFLPKKTNINRDQGFDFDTPYLVTMLMRSKKIPFDSIYNASTKRAIYLMPLQVGTQWHGYPSSYGFIQVRKVQSIENITTNNRQYQCFKVQTSINSEVFKPDETWYDYVAREGIILRMIALTMEISTETNPNGIGRATFYERLELISQF